MTTKKAVNILGESKTVPWTNSKGSPMPKCGGEIISDYFTGDDAEIAARVAELSKLHKAPFEVHAL